MMTQVDVSVVVPCFRCAATVGRAIESVLNQSVLPKQLILVDDASGDDTLAVLQDWAQRYPAWIEVVALPVNGGAGEARNAGWDRALGEFVAFLDADDSWHSLKLASQVAWMQANPQVVLCGHAHNVEGDRADEDSKPTTARRIQVLDCLIRNPFVTPSVMVRKSITARFAPAMRYMEDHRLWLEIVFSGGEAARLSGHWVTLHKPHGSAGLSSHFWAMSKGDWENYDWLRREGWIGRVAYFFWCVWLGLKFARRLLLVGWSGGFHGKRQ